MELNIYNAANGTSIRHPYRLDFREVETSKNVFRKQAEYAPNSLLLPFGDREVFGLVSLDGIQLWFFNPNFVPDLPDAMPSLHWRKVADFALSTNHLIQYFISYTYSMHDRLVRPLIYFSSIECSVTNSCDYLIIKGIWSKRSHCMY